MLQSSSGLYGVDGGTFPFGKTIGPISKNCHHEETSKEGRTTTNKIDKFVYAYTLEKEGREDLFTIKKYIGFEAKESERTKGEIYPGSMNTGYLTQMIGISINTPNRDGMFMLFGDNLAKRRL